MNKYLKIALIALGVFSVLLLSNLLFLHNQRLDITQETRVNIPPQATYQDLCDSLSAHDCIFSPMGFNMLARLRGLPNHVKPGSYVMQPGEGVIHVIQKLYSGSQTPIRLAITKKRTPEQLCQYLGDKLALDADTLLALMRDAEVCQSYGETPQTIIGMFTTNTYEVYWTISPRALLDRMHRESETFWEPRASQLTALGLTRQQVLTIASIVEEETNYNPEKADIASVYLNRYRIGMPLQADPTVKYAVGDFSIRRIWGAMLSIDNPYNTYKYQGLPPGPICIPSTSSIDAVLKNKKTDYFYFCAKEDFSGQHNFSATISQHQANAQKFHKALNDRKIR